MIKSNSSRRLLASIIRSSSKLQAALYTAKSHSFSKAVKETGVTSRAEDQVSKIEASILIYNALIVNDSADLVLEWLESTFEISIGSFVEVTFSNGLENLRASGKLIGAHLDLKGKGVSLVIRNPSSVVKGTSDASREQWFRERWFRERYCRIEKTTDVITGVIREELTVMISLDEETRASRYSFNIVV